MAMVRDRKTGRMRQLNAAKSRVAKQAAKKRMHKPLTTATKIAIAKGVKASNRTGRTKLGRRVIKKAASTSSHRPGRTGSV